MSVKYGNDSVAKITVGGESTFSIFVLTNEGRPVDLSEFSSANLVFLNLSGTRSSIAQAIPDGTGGSPEPASGELPVTIPSSEAANADDKWISADLELIRPDTSQIVVVLKNKFEIEKRVAPPTS